MDTQQESKLQIPTSGAEIDALFVYENEIKNQKLDARHHAWINYKAVNGLVFDRDGVESFTKDGKRITTGMPLRKITVKEFAESVGVSVYACHKWTREIPNFWRMVADRRKKLSGGDRLAKVHEEWFKAAAKVNNWAVTEAWLHNFDEDFKSLKPTVNVDAKVTVSWVEQLQRKIGVSEADVVEHEQAGRLLIEGQVQSENSEAGSIETQDQGQHLPLPELQGVSHNTNEAANQAL